MGCYVKTVYSDSVDSAPGVTVQLGPTKTIEYAKLLMEEKRKAARHNDNRGRPHS